MFQTEVKARDWISFAIGNAYYYGVGTKKDISWAKAYYTQPAKNGLVYAQLGMGNCCRNEGGIFKNRKEALLWYQLAAEQGNREAKKLLDELKSEMEQRKLRFPFSRK